ncbi:uncharacterized protein LOC123692430 [Colias croceus]|uniref:uncharacterized protein LOC123692430 n=1 Tax=Colias crocea TaxID=72248 RepID=UPI001E27E719|nr:uncharacterized protein LOC123692430 [Colias croceus]
MDKIANKKCLVLHSNTIEMVRKEINLSRPGEMKEVINILKEWVKMQPHFKKKDFPDSYLERCIVASKGSVEKAKNRLDKMCTMRTLMPEFFEDKDLTKDFKELFETVILTICPKLTKEHQRVFVIKAYKNPSSSKLFTTFFKYGVYLAEYERKYDYIAGFRIVYDFRNLDLINFVSKLNIVETRHAVSLFMQGYGLKIKGIHIISDSKGVDLFVNIIKQILKPKLASRISTHKTFEEIHDIVGKDVLPAELGGYERPIKEIHEDWIAELGTEENMEYMREMNKAGTDETLRSRDKFNEDYAGMPGTFRVLSLD